LTLFTKALSIAVPLASSAHARASMSSRSSHATTHSPYSQPTRMLGTPRPHLERELLDVLLMVRLATPRAPALLLLLHGRNRGYTRAVLFFFFVFICFLVLIHHPSMIYPPRASLRSLCSRWGFWHFGVF